MNQNVRAGMTFLFGVLGMLMPFAGVHAATFLGRSDLANFNSSIIMLLSVLLIVFLVVNAFSNFIDNHKKIFIMEVVLLLLSIASFIYNLAIFVTL
ncbi:Uncharacterised protein [uncultured archaeon]|nr:Uncharacterised protein [uncultured archaeon]